jgi:hypothetical protein
MTGIMQISKEGIFSGLNNLAVDTILNRDYENYFGLSEQEVDNALKEYKLENDIRTKKYRKNGVSI